MVKRGLSTIIQKPTNKLRQKAVEIANKLLAEGAEEGVAIATGLKLARESFVKDKNKKKDK